LPPSECHMPGRHSLRGAHGGPNSPPNRTEEHRCSLRHTSAVPHALEAKKKAMKLMWLKYTCGCSAHVDKSTNKTPLTNHSTTTLSAALP
jgi:hypothetical protein